MLTTSALANTASLVGDIARASMLCALMDGRALTAAELARVAGIAPQTASGHLARLVDAGILACERQGRHKYHRLASPAVASMIENIMTVADASRSAAAGARAAPVVGPRDAALRQARTCYDHLAGRLAVDIADSLVAGGHVELSDDGGLLTPKGDAFLRAIGIDLDTAYRQAPSHGRGRIFCRPCLDWSERRPHIAGALGAALCRCCLERDWIRRRPGSRAVTVTPLGAKALHDAFGYRN